jgi:cytochrome b561
LPFNGENQAGVTKNLISNHIRRHTVLGNVIIWLAGLHAAAALFHHYVLRDGVLTSMLPDWKRSPELGAPAGQIPR